MSLTYKMERVTLRWFWNLKDQIGTLNSSRTKYRRKKKFRWMKYPPILLTKGKKYSANLRLRIKICMLSHHYIHIPMSGKHYLMFRLIVVSSFSPLSNCCTMKNNHSEIWIQKQDPISCNGSHIKKGWFWARMKWERYQWWLNHHYWVGDIFSI